MIEMAVEFLQVIALQYGILGLFLAEIIEEVIVPIPSAAVMMSAGFLFLGGQAFSFAAFEKLFFQVTIPLALGLMIGSLFIYGLTYYFGRRIVDRYGRFLGVSWSDVEKTQKYFSRGYSDEVLFILVRAIPLVPSVAVNAFCGLIRMPLKKYLSLTFLGASARGFLMGFVGWQAGSVYFKYADAINRLENIVLLVIVFLCVGFFLYRRSKTKNRPSM